MTFTLRPADPSDRDWLDRLRRDVYRDLFDATWGGWDEARHLRHFAACWERGRIQVIVVDGADVGMLQVFEHDDDVELSEVQVAPDRQGAGLGTAVVRQVIARASGRDVVLSTGLRNDGARRLYERLGFVVTARTETHTHLRHVARDEG